MGHPPGQPPDRLHLLCLPELLLTLAQGLLGVLALDRLRQHVGDGLQKIYLVLLEGAWSGGVDRQHAERAVASGDHHARPTDGLHLGMGNRRADRARRAEILDHPRLAGEERLAGLVLGGDRNGSLADQIIRPAAALTQQERIAIGENLEVRRVLRLEGLAQQRGRPPHEQIELPAGEGMEAEFRHRRLLARLQPQRLLRLLERGDVGEHDHRSLDLAGTDEGRRGVLDRKRRPVLPPQHLIVELDIPAIAQGHVHRAILHRIGRTIGLSVMDQRVQVSAQQLLACVAQQARGAAVDEGAAPSQIDSVDPFPDRLEECHLAGPLPLEPGSLGDVEESHREAVGQANGGGTKPVLAAALPVAEGAGPGTARLDHRDAVAEDSAPAALGKFPEQRHPRQRGAGPVQDGGRGGIGIQALEIDDDPGRIPDAAEDHEPVRGHLLDPPEHLAGYPVTVPFVAGQARTHFHYEVFPDRHLNGFFSCSLPLPARTAAATSAPRSLQDACVWHPAPGTAPVPVRG